MASRNQSVGARPYASPSLPACPVCHRPFGACDRMVHDLAPGDPVRAAVAAGLLSRAVAEAYEAYERERDHAEEAAYEAHREEQRADDDEAEAHEAMLTAWEQLGER